MISKESLETAYCFLHQKLRVYQYSTMEWQKDDIEIAIASYVDDMNHELYTLLSGEYTDYLVNHHRFGEDMMHGVATLEKMLGL